MFGMAGTTKGFGSETNFIEWGVILIDVIIYWCYIWAIFLFFVFVIAELIKKLVHEFGCVCSISEPKSTDLESVETGHLITE